MLPLVAPGGLLEASVAFFSGVIEEARFDADVTFPPLVTSAEAGPFGFLSDEKASWSLSLIVVRLLANLSSASCSMLSLRLTKLFC